VLRKKKLLGGASAGAPPLGTLEDMLGRYLDAGISLLEEGARIPGTLVGE